MNPEYKTNLMKLKNFVMVMFGKDTMVDPKETEVPLHSFLLMINQVFFVLWLEPGHPIYKLYH